MQPRTMVRIVFGIMAVVLLVACGPKLPSEQLVGHWQWQKGSDVEEYFGKGDAFGVGSYVLVIAGEIERTTYKLVLENTEKNR